MCGYIVNLGTPVTSPLPIATHIRTGRIRAYPFASKNWKKVILKVRHRVNALAQID